MPNHRFTTHPEVEVAPPPRGHLRGPVATKVMQNIWKKGRKREGRMVIMGGTPPPGGDAAAGDADFPGAKREHDFGLKV